MILKVDSPIKNWGFFCSRSIRRWAPCNVLQIEWKIEGTTNSCAAIARCALPFQREFLVQEGENVRIQIENLDYEMKASCEIVADGEVVSRGEVRGLSDTVCEAIIGE